MKKINYLLLAAMIVGLFANAQAPLQDCDALPDRIRIFDSEKMHENLKKVFGRYKQGKSKYDKLNEFVQMADPNAKFKDELEYTVQTFLDLMDKIKTTAGIGAPTGLRIYFLSPAPVIDATEMGYASGQLNQVVPVWVPTNFNGNEDANILDANSLPFCFFFTPQKQVVRLSHETVKTWRGNFDKLWGILNSHIGRLSFFNGASRQDTRSLWYKWEYIAQLGCFLEKKVRDGDIAPDAVFKLAFATYPNISKKHFQNYNNQNVTAKVSRQLDMVMEFPNLDKVMWEGIRKFWQNKNDNSEKGKQLNDDYVKSVNAINLRSDFHSADEKEKLRLQLLQKFVKDSRDRDPDTAFNTALPCPPATKCIVLEP